LAGTARALTSTRAVRLSTYLGHLNPAYTYHYLSAAPQLLAHAARMLDAAQEARR
jgi:integrase/recombinase XerD